MSEEIERITTLENKIEQLLEKQDFLYSTFLDFANKYNALCKKVYDLDKTSPKMVPPKIIRK